MNSSEITVKSNKIETGEHSFHYKYFSDYYKQQGIIDEQSYDEFLAVMKKSLSPSYFINQYHENGVQKLKTIMKYLSDSSKDSSNFDIPPAIVDWIKNECVWKWKEKEIVECSSDECFTEFKKFFYQQKACNNIICQDALDMLPIILLDAQPHHKVLDMSGQMNHKFFQLADVLRLRTTTLSDGLLVLAETNPTKCQELSDALYKHVSPHFCLVNMDTKYLPLMFLPTPSVDAGLQDELHNFLTYDRVLCFLPSSNDGLIRKNPELVKEWTWNVPLGHHGNLCEMLNSGLGVLSIGGQLVFAVNSMNPIEGEAVISTVLYQQKGSVELVDVSSELLPDVYEKGLTKWKVLANQNRWFSKAEDVPEYLWSQVWTSMFPPSAELASQQNLNRCIRILPHKNDTSGMFVAVLRRIEYLEDAIKKEDEANKKAWEEAQEQEIKKQEEEAHRLEEKRKRKLEKKKKLLGDKNEEYCNESSSTLDNKKEENIDETAAVGSCSADVMNESEKAKKSELLVQETVKSSEEAEPEKKKQKSENLDHNKLAEHVDRSNEVELKETQNSKTVDHVMTLNDNHDLIKVGMEKESDVHKEEISTTIDELKRITDAPIEFMDPENYFLSEIKTFFGLSAGFPSHLLYMRMFEEVPFYCYLVSQLLKELLVINLSKYTFVETGVKVFAYTSRYDVDCRFRIAQEGVQYVYPYMTKQVVHASKKDITTVLSDAEIHSYNLSSSMQNKLAKISNGSFVIAYEPSDEDDFDKPLVLTCLKTNSIFKNCISEYQRVYYLRLLGVPFKKYDDSGQSVKDALFSFSHHFKELKD